VRAQYQRCVVCDRLAPGVEILCDSCGERLRVYYIVDSPDPERLLSMSWDNLEESECES